MNTCSAFIAGFKQLKRQHEELCVQEICLNVIFGLPSILIISLVNGSVTQFEYNGYECN